MIMIKTTIETIETTGFAMKQETLLSQSCLYCLYCRQKKKNDSNGLMMIETTIETTGFDLKQERVL